MSNKENNLLSMKTKRPRSKSGENSRSNGSDDYIISNQENSTYTIKHISKFEKFKEIVSQIKNPCYTTDKEFLNKSSFFEISKDKNNLNKEINYLIPLDQIDKSKVFSIESPQEFFRNNNRSQTGNFIFSNLFDEEKRKEETLFNNIHNYCNCYYLDSYISSFCLDYELHFPNNDVNYFCEINRKDFFVESMKVFHYHDYGIGHFYAPKGSGKSLLFRSIFVNFINFQKDPERYTPLMFFDINLLQNLIINQNLYLIKKILLHESYSLFKQREDSVELIKRINLNNKNIMEIILEVMNIVVLEIKEKRKVFILDGYSCEYDNDGILKEIIKLVYGKKNFFVEVIYDIKSPRDAEMLYINLNPYNHINYNTNLIEKFYYFDKLKLFSDIKKNLKENEIPEKYSEIFGENVSYFFEHEKNNNISFDDFVKKKKLEIKNEILSFCDENCRFHLNEINEYIENNNVFLYEDIIKYVPSNYIKIIIEPKPIPENFGDDLKNEKFPKYYKLEYSFPLIKEIMKEIIMENGFINMKNPQFLQLPGPALGINFDIEMNKILQELIDKEYFFEHKIKTKIFVDDILEKFGLEQSQKIKENTEKDELYKDAIAKLYDRNEILEQRIKFENIDFNQFTCIAVFQNYFFGKAFDLLFFIKNKENTLFDMNLVQIKCSNSYKENQKELQYQVIYVKEKFQFLLKIQIKNLYVSYLSIYQKPKHFAESNKSRTFLYDIMKDKFVNFNGQEYTQFPLLKNSIIYSKMESNILNKINYDFIFFHNMNIKLFKKEKRNNYVQKKSVDEIRDILFNNELYLYVSSEEFNYYYKINNSFNYSLRKGKFLYKEHLDNFYDIK